MRFYNFYYQGRLVKTYVARSKNAAVLMAKGDFLIYDDVKYSRT